MRILLTLLALLISTTALAETKWYFDLEREGEGIIVTEYDDPEDPRVIFAFYSHTETVALPPTVSPPPPAPLFCDRHTVWFTGISLEGFLTEDAAYGLVYYQVAVPTFPEPENGFVSDTYVVGDFILKREDKGYDGGAGFSLEMRSNYLMCNLSVFNRVHHLTKRIAE